ncbi:Type II secretion system protein GspC N-terminal domain-containing protein [Microcystis aeruginosa]
MPAGYEENPRMPLDKVIFVIACLYLGWVVAWLISQKNAPISQNGTISREDQKFIAYLQSSLAIIDRQGQTSSPDPNPAAKNNPSPVATVPPPPPANLPVNNTPQIIERIYVPVYPQTPETTAKIAPVTPSSTDISAPPLPAAPQGNRPVAAVIPTNNQVKNILVGVMDLGDQSSALFDNKGITTRISPGEFINGWTLVEVGSQQVILSRNGQTKVLEVGQSF